jgi:hypothetical protein
MKSIIYFLIIFLLGLFFYNIQINIIEPMCIVPEPQGGKEDYNACQNITINKNNERMNILEKTFKNLLGQLKIHEKNNSMNQSNIKKNKKSIRSMNRTAGGADVDVSGACDKYPESC